jgi:hypothetical protein
MGICQGSPCPRDERSRRGQPRTRHVKRAPAGELSPDETGMRNRRRRAQSRGRHPGGPGWAAGLRLRGRRRDWVTTVVRGPPGIAPTAEKPLDASKRSTFSVHNPQKVERAKDFASGRRLEPHRPFRCPPGPPAAATAVLSPVLGASAEASRAPRLRVARNLLDAAHTPRPRRPRGRDEQRRRARSRDPSKPSLSVGGSDHIPRSRPARSGGQRRFTLTVSTGRWVSAGERARRARRRGLRGRGALWSGAALRARRAG